MKEPICDICKKNRLILQNISKNALSAVKLAYKTELRQSATMRVCEKCHFHITLMEDFMQSLVRHNFPNCVASKTECFSCHSSQIVQDPPVTSLVREIKDFHSSPKSGAEYFGCLDCIYKAKAYKKYKKLLSPHFVGSRVTETCMEELFTKLKKRGRSRKQQVPELPMTYKINELPILPEVRVLLRKLSPLKESKRAGRPLKRKLDRDFVYSTKMSKKSTNRQTSVNPLVPFTQLKPIVKLYRLNSTELNGVSTNDNDAQQITGRNPINGEYEMNDLPRLKTPFLPILQSPTKNNISMMSPMRQDFQNLYIDDNGDMQSSAVTSCSPSLHLVNYSSSDSDSCPISNTKKAVFFNEEIDYDHNGHQSVAGDTPPREQLLDNYSSDSDSFSYLPKKSVSFSESVEVFEYEKFLQVEDVSVDPIEPMQENAHIDYINLIEV